MRPTQSFGALLLCLSTIQPLAAAWPAWLPELELFVARRDGSSSTSAPAPSQTSSPQQSSSPATNSANPTQQQTNSVNLNTASIATDSAGNIITATDGSQPTHTDFDPRDPAGGVVMVTPAATLGTQLYRIGDTVTWAWNYTNLQANPTAIDVLVSCPTATQTWTLTQNMTFETMATVTWDTSEQETPPLLTAQYVLVIYDADSSISAVPSAGYLGPFSGFSFGLYTPQPYNNLSDWNCAACSSAASSLDTRAMGVAISMSVITLLSFTWFVTGLRVMW